MGDADCRCPAFSRRAFLARVGGPAAAAAALLALPEVLGIPGLHAQARAALRAPPLLTDTWRGVAALFWAGDDPYSRQQGEAAPGPGAVAAGADRQIIAALDAFVPAPDLLLSNDLTVPLSAAIGAALDAVALELAPGGRPGPFPSAFANLPIAAKIEVWRRLETLPRRLSEFDHSHSIGVLSFVFGNLPAFVQFFACSEGAVFDPVTGSLRGRPVGWTHSGYLDGALRLAEGWDELRGYYAGRTEALP